MIIEEFIPILSMIGFGLFILKFFQFKGFRFSLPEQIIYILTLFCSIYIIPMAFFGSHAQIFFFQTWPLLLGLIGLLYSGFFIYGNYKKVIIYLEPLGTKDKLKNWFSLFKTKNGIIISVIVLLILFFTIFNLILPFRDFDAIWMYIPDAMWYYRVNYIPDFNLLNFRLSTKEPLISLLFTYSLYTTGDLNIKLLPIFFIIGWSATIYVFAQKLWDDTTKSCLAVLLFLVSPFMYYIINFWVYYQEIYVSFFYSVTLLCIYNLSCNQKNQLDKITAKGKELFYILIGSLSFALTLLSKLSGWSLIFVILLVVPLSKYQKLLQSLMIVGLSIFLALKVSVDYYFGVGLAILLYSCFILYLLWRKTTIYEEPNPSVSQRTTSLGIFAIIPLGILLGGFWLYDTLEKFSMYSNSFQQLYISLPNLNFKTIFIGTSLNSNSFLLETAQSANFFGIVLYLLVGNTFVLFWLLPKLRVVLDEQMKFFVLWILGFFILWLSYYGESSIRYLSVILVPMVILVAHGVHKLYQDITKKKQSVTAGVVLFASVLTFTSYYYPISPAIFSSGINNQIINNEFLLSAYNYYQNSLLYLLFALLLSVLFLLYYTRWNKNISIKKLHYPFKRGILGPIAIILILFIPFMIPTFVFASVDSNLNDFNATYVYYQRPAFKDVINALLQENSPTSGILGIDVPGLAIYLNQPTVDLFVQSDELKPIFADNITAILQFITDPVQYAKENYNITVGSNLLSSSFSFDYIVLPNYANNIYNYYAHSLYSQSFLFPLLFQKSLFQVIYTNNEFIVFKRIYTNSQFYGIVNSYLIDQTNNISIMGTVQLGSKLSNNVNLGLTCSLPDLSGSNLTINSTIALKLNNDILTIHGNTSLRETSKSIFSVVLPLTSQLTQPNSFSILNVTVDILQNNTKGVNLQEFVLSSNILGIPLPYNSVGRFWTVVEGPGLVEV